MIDDKRMIHVIIEYIESLPEPTSSWPPGYFREASYERTAANDILTMVLANPEWPVIRSIEEYKSMVKNKQLTHYDDINYIFDVAYDVATDIIDILMAMI